MYLITHYLGLLSFIDKYFPNVFQALVATTVTVVARTLMNGSFLMPSKQLQASNAIVAADSNERLLAQKDAMANRLAGALRIKTVSYEDRYTDIREQLPQHTLVLIFALTHRPPLKQEFLTLHKYLSDNYPVTHKVLYLVCRVWR